MPLNNLACVSVTLGLLLTGVNVRAQELSELSLPPNGMNPKAEVSQWIGLVKVTIAYHSPNVHGPAGRDRTGHIWGELVKYGMFAIPVVGLGGAPAPTKRPRSAFPTR
jgi:hypothetical protein